MQTAFLALQAFWDYNVGHLVVQMSWQHHYWHTSTSREGTVSPPPCLPEKEWHKWRECHKWREYHKWMECHNVTLSASYGWQGEQDFSWCHASAVVIIEDIGINGDDLENTIITKGWSWQCWRSCWNRGTYDRPIHRQAKNDHEFILKHSIQYILIIWAWKNKYVALSNNSEGIEVKEKGKHSQS